MIETAKKILDYKLPTEANIVSILYKKPSELYNINLTLKDFSENVWKVYFQIIHDIILVEKKEVIDDVVIGLYLEKHPKLKQKYTEYGGFGMITSAMSYVNVENLDGYISELRKWNTLIQLCKRGFPVKDRLSDFTDMTAEEIYNEYQLFLNDTFIHIDSDVKSYDICYKIDELIEKLDAGSAIGLPYYDIPILSKETGGQYLGSITLLGGISNSGKEQPISEPILTKDGWIPMGEVKVGTKVYGKDGHLHRVIDVFPQGIKNVYEVTFNDGTKTRCGAEHLWKVYTKKQRYKNNQLGNDSHYKILSLSDIMKDYKKEYKYKNRKITSYKYSIPLCEPINFNNSTNLPIDPYVLGLLLGDGGLTENVITFTNAEDELFEQLEELLLPIGIKLHYKDCGCYKRATLVYPQKTHSNKLKDILATLNLLGCDSRQKFVPEIYKQSDIKSRAKLLSGIINTDGCVDYPSCTSITISTYSEVLCKDITDIARSLGYKVSVAQYDRTDESSTKKYEKEIEYVIRIMSNDWSLLSLSKKHIQKLKTLPYKRNKSITNIELVGKEESQCILIDGDEHLYITNDYIVTHNSTVVRSTTVPSIIEKNEKIVIMVNEDSLEKWQREFLIWICNNILKFDIQKHIVRDGGFTKEVKEKLFEASNWLKEKSQNHTITIIPFQQYQTSKAIKEIRKYASLGVKYFILDTFKMDAGKVSANAWMEMQQNMVAIKDTVKSEALNVHILITFQLEKGSSTMRYYTQNNIGMAKNIVDVASTCIMIRDIYDDEYTDEKRALKVYRLEGSNGKTKISVKLDKDKKYQVLFIVKNQEGAANSYQIVIEHDKSRNIIREVGITNISPDF